MSRYYVTDGRIGLQILRDGAGRYEEERRILEVRGRDARDYLHRMTSQDIAALEPGHWSRTLVLTPEGRMIGAPWVWATEDAFLLDLEPENADAVKAHLERFVIAEDVSFTERPATAWWAAGPRVAKIFPNAAPAPPRAGEWVPSGREATPRYVGGLAADDRPPYRMLVPRDTLSAGPFSLETQPRILPFASLVADNSWDAWRVLHRFPVWGPELSGDILPLEARLERDAISFSKGCYPGQEPIVMARHRGHPPTLLVRVRAKGATAGAALLFEGRKVGRITTVGRWPEHDEPNAMAFVKYTLVAEPTALEVEGGGEARVVEGEGP